MYVNLAGFISKLKQKGQTLLSVSGIGFLILVVVFVSSVSKENDRRYSELLEHMATMKIERDVTNRRLDTALKSQKLLNSKQREKREIVEGNAESGSQFSKGGAVYIRWGRTSCPENNTKLVYSGIAGGSWYEHYGAATNFQCLPSKPVWGRFTSGTGLAYMYGMEYEENMEGIMHMSNVQNKLVNHNVPCAVCRSSIRTSSLMIPAMNVCVAGWHLEYHGYLMAGHYSHKSGTQYICVDESPETDKAGFKDDNGALLYRVKANCGSLPCPDYVQYRELTCALCTK